MIEDLRALDDDRVLAVGDRFDAETVLAAMFGLIDDFVAFGRERGFEGAYTLSTPSPSRPDDDPIVRMLKDSGQPFKLPYGRHTPRLIGALVRKEREDYDAGGLRHAVMAPPFRFDLYPLGVDPLYANFGACRDPGSADRWITVDGAPWTDFDPAPLLRVHRFLPERPESEMDAPRPADEFGLTRAQRKLLMEFLGTQRHRGFAPDLTARESVTLRCPHAVFGDGRGDIRIALLRAGGD